MDSLMLPVSWKGKTLQADLSSGYCIAIPLDHTQPQPNAFFAPLYEALPHKQGDWIGDTREGASVNFLMSGSIHMEMGHIRNVWVIYQMSDILFIRR